MIDYQRNNLIPFRGPTPEWQKTRWPGWAYVGVTFVLNGFLWAVFLGAAFMVAALLHGA